MSAKSFYELEHTNWESGAKAYDQAFGSLTSQSISTLLRQVGYFSRDRTRDKYLLDVATGPGYVISHLLKEDPQACKLIGLDFSKNMLNLAEKCIAEKHQGAQVQFIEGNAEGLPFDDSSFDFVCCNYGILHLTSPDLFLTEAFRCLKPGGRLSFTVWAAPPDTEAFGIVLGAITDVGNPNVSLPAGPPFFRFADEREASRSLSAVGFVDIERTVVQQSWDNILGPSELYFAFLEGTARTRALLEGQTKEQTEAVKHEISRRFYATVGVKKRSLSMPAVISSASKPL